MTTKPYFTTIVTAQTEKELKARIADNELRGFKVVKIVPIEKEDHVYRGGNKRGRYEYGGVDVHRSYKAVMRRENDGR